MATFAFTDTALFSTVRSSHLTDRGLYRCDDDGRLGFHFVFADAAFYDLEAWLDNTQSEFFSAVAQRETLAQTNGARAIVSGQFFQGHSWVDVHLGPYKWEGDVIQNFTVMDGDPVDRSDYRYFGKWAGRTQAAYSFCERGNPRDVSPRFEHAIGTLIPLIKNNTAFSRPPNITAGTAYYSPVVKTFYYAQPGGMGKAIYGIHKATNLVFFLVQENAHTGKKLDELVDLLVAMGIDAAVMGDASDSVGLILDGTVLAQPEQTWYKDTGLDAGLVMRLRTLSFLNASMAFQICTDATLAGKLGTLPVTRSGGQGSISWGTSGPVLTISTFCTDVSATDLGVAAIPTTLQWAGGTSILASDGGMYFQDSGTFPTFFVHLGLSVSGSEDPGTLTGEFSLTGSRTIAGTITAALES